MIAETIQIPKHARWTIDPAHSSVEFAVKHLMIATVRGRFESLRGDVETPELDPARSRVRAEIDAASLHTGAPDRDAHLRSPDFFDVAAHPTLVYESRRVERAGDGFRVVGDLTIRGVMREVPLLLEVEGTTTDPWGKSRVAVVARGKIDRRDFGLTWNKALETGGVLVGDEVRITIHAQLVAA